MDRTNPIGQVRRNEAVASSAQFRLSITRALGDQLAAALSQLAPDPLTEHHLDRLSSLPGVYQLYHLRSLVYIGKAERSLPDRLRQHKRKISGRRNIVLEDVGFTCLYVDEDLSAVAPERLLIDAYRATGTCPWNYNGFGNNDPGIERDTTQVGLDHFDAQYPINLDYECQIAPGTYSLVDLLPRVKAALPFNFRYQHAKRRRNQQPEEYHTHSATVSSASMTADGLFGLIAEALPSGWQVTALPGYVIMYREQRDYPSATKTYLS